MASASPGAITSAMLGAFRERKETRDELLSEDGYRSLTVAARIGANSVSDGLRKRHRRLATIAKNAG
jgi:hypothetical protein